MRSLSDRSSLPPAAMPSDAVLSVLLPPLVTVALPLAETLKAPTSTLPPNDAVPPRTFTPLPAPPVRAALNATWPAPVLEKFAPAARLTGPPNATDAAAAFVHRPPPGSDGLPSGPKPAAVSRRRFLLIVTGTLML